VNKIREDLIKHKLKQISANLNTIKENLPDTLDNFKNLGLIKDGIYKKVENSIQDIISICSIINSDLNLGIPTNRDDIIDALMKNEIISKNLGIKIKKMKGFRNFLVHRYGDIQDDIAYKDIKAGLSDFNDFRKEILRYLEKLKE